MKTTSPTLDALSCNACGLEPATNLCRAAQAAAFEAQWNDRDARPPVHLVKALLPEKARIGWLAVAHNVLGRPVSGKALAALLECVEHGYASFEHTALWPEFAALFSAQEKQHAGARLELAREHVRRRNAAVPTTA